MTEPAVRTVAVTGAASGIGAAVTALLTGRGDRVIGVDRHPGDGHRVRVVADLGTDDGRTAAAERIATLADGALDGLVTCAGTAAWDESAVTVNYFGTTRLVTALRPALARSTAPRVVLLGSIAGTHPADADTVAGCLEDDETRAVQAARAAVAEGRGHELYPASKAALARWARRTAVSAGWADAGIALNVVAPGVVLTPMTADLVTDPEIRRLMDETVPMPLNGHAPATAVAEAVGFLVGAANTHATGQVLYVDGGAEALTRDPA